MIMEYIDKLNNGEPISIVFTAYRNTSYRHLYIVSARKKEALLHYSDENKAFLSEWYDHIDDFDNFIYTKVHLGDNYNYIYPTGKLVSPYWSDEMSKINQTLWPIVFNGKYNLIKDDGNLLLHDFADGIWADDNDSNSFILKISSSYSYSREYTYNRLTSDGKTQFLGRCAKYDIMPVVDVYSSKSNLTDKIFLHRRLFSLSVEDFNGKELISDVLGIIKYNIRPISDLKGISEGDQGVLFSVRKEKLAGNEELLLSYDFATIRCANGYRLLCFSTDSILSDTFEDVQVLKSLYIKVRKDGFWNIIDKYGDYVSKELWFDNIELMSNGNAIVKKGEQYNFLKSNGILLSSEWYDEISSTTETGKFIVRKRDAYNVIDNNLRLSNQKWQDTTEGLPLSPKKSNLPVSESHKTWSTIRVYDPVWVDNNGIIVECYVLSYSKSKLTILWPINGDGKVEAKEIEIRHINREDFTQTSIGGIFLNEPERGKYINY